MNSSDIMETIEMLTDENLDVRTVTMGISLLDCIDPGRATRPARRSTTRSPAWPGNLVSAVDGISAEYGIPIVNKRISVTPIAMLLGACSRRRPGACMPKRWTAPPRPWGSTSSAASARWCTRAFPPATSR